MRYALNRMAWACTIISLPRFYIEALLLVYTIFLLLLKPLLYLML